MKHKALLAIGQPVNGTDQADTFVGTDKADVFYGGLGSDSMSGGQGSDQLFGGSGKDVLNGGTGQDFLTGGSGEDTFVYTQAGDAGGAGSRDVIYDFQSGADKLDVHAFMAGGHFIGSASFVAGEGATLRYVRSTGTLSGDVDGDGKLDFAITLDNHTALLATDFIF